MGNNIKELFDLEFSPELLLKEISVTCSLDSLFFFCKYFSSQEVLENLGEQKSSGGDGIPVELFQFLKDDGMKVLLSIR